MDNNPNQPNQLDQDDPVFSSSDLTQTKARKDTHFFTNVQKATLGQKISEWFNKLNRESLEHSAARKAAFKAKLEERRRAADLAAISAAVPNAPVPTRPATSAPAPTAPPANVPTQPTPTPAAPVVPAPAPAAPAPATLVSAPAPIAPATTPNQQPTIIIEDTPQPPRKSRRTVVLAIIILGILLVIGIIAALLIIRPWDHQPDTNPSVQVMVLKSEPTGNIDMAAVSNFEAISFRAKVLNSTNIDVYTDNQLSSSSTVSPYIIADNIDKVLQLNEITDPTVILLFEIEKARIFIIYEDYESAWEILGQIDEASLYESQQEVYFTVMELYFETIGDTAKAQEYADKYAALPVDNRGI